MGTLSLGKTKRLGQRKFLHLNLFRLLFLHAKEPKLDGTKHFINLHGVCGQELGQSTAAMAISSKMSGALGRRSLTCDLQDNC